MDEITFIKYHFNKTGGLEKYSKKIIEYFLKKKFKINIITTSDFDFSNNFIKIYRYKPKFISFINILLFDFFIKKTIRQNNLKNIFSLDRSSIFNYTRLGNGVHRAFLDKKKLFESFFKSFLNKINPLHLILKKIEKDGFYNKKVKKIIVNSKMVKNELMEYYKIDNAKIEVIFNGVDFINHSVDMDRKNFLKENNLDDKYTFLFIGNGYKRKGLDLLLKAISTIDRDFNLLIVGKEKKINFYKKLVKKLKLEEKVKFFNHSDTIYKFYNSSHILVLPTFYDPFANVTLEAISTGIKVITTKYNGASEIINEKNGYILENLSDINKFREILLKVMEEKNEKNEIIDSIAHLTFENQLKKLIDVVEDA
ncbi:MAG: hypothetical protein A3F40_01980 [Chlamydiae bacterium RIFCSPHIGHO2_12_FULL_27_8]|nr:MAG: hypothetical protein A3F40_01980 [Chlamydiae bacterium RIFCSPHIGHO2_12_FULL_27_8]